MQHLKDLTTINIINKNHFVKYLPLGFTIHIDYCESETSYLIEYFKSFYKLYNYRNCRWSESAD